MEQSGIDISAVSRYVRVTGIRKNAFVEFDFSIDDPTLFIELVLPFDQFQAFCTRHQVKQLSAEQQTRVDLDKLKWRYGQVNDETDNSQHETIGGEH